VTPNLWPLLAGLTMVIIGWAGAWIVLAVLG
jgi:hypothetical protein